MARLSLPSRRGLLLAAQVAAGGATVGAASFYIYTRRCFFEPLTRENGRTLLQHPILRQINPWNKPAFSDSCVREVPLDQIDGALLEDTRKGGSRLVERYAGGMWGGFGECLSRCW